MAKCINHGDKLVEFECKDHCEKMCSVCAAMLHCKCKEVISIELEETKEVKVNSKKQNVANNTLRKTQNHKAVARLIKSASFDDKDKSVPSFIDPQALAHDFAHARSIFERKTRSKSQNEGTLKTAEMRIQSRVLAQKQTKFGKQASVEEVHEHPIEKPRRQLTKLNSNNSDIKTSNDSSERFGHASNNNSDRHPIVAALHTSVDSPEFDLHLSSLNDILEEDEDIISVTNDRHVSNSHMSLINEFYIRSQYDNKCCSIVGMCALTDSRLLLADEANENVKLFGRNGLYETHLNLETNPWDVTAMENFEAAVSCPSTKCMHVIRIHDTMTITRTLDLDKKCYGIEYHCGEIYVAMENEIRIMTCDGKIVRKISSQSTRKRLFSLPLSIPKAPFRSARYLSINAAGKSVIVVSDSFKACVTLLSKRGEILSRLGLAEDGVPSGVAVGSSGELYVCQEPNKLVVIHSDEQGNHVKTLAELEAIQSVHFHRMSKLLLVSRKAHNFINVYQVKNDFLV